MKKCKRCNISFNINSKRCPLCNKTLEGSNKYYVFPSKVKKDKTNFILIIILISTILVANISVLIEYLITKNIMYSMYLDVLLLLNYLFIFFILKNKYNVIAIINRYALFLIVLLYFLSIILNSKLINNIFIPALCIMLVIFQMVVFIIQKIKYKVDYLRLLLLLVIILLGQIVFVIQKLITYKVLTINEMERGTYGFDSISSDYSKSRKLYYQRWNYSHR